MGKGSLWDVLVYLYIYILVRLYFAQIQLFFFPCVQKEIVGSQLVIFCASELTGVASLFLIEFF